mmetsp:Transcript_20787/g.69409  ORF Transcript_20787/g.69409 Transcript_20787/m.69409 type:complete len:208 (-) Transcript_20787:143-766(-)
MHAACPHDIQHHGASSWPQLDQLDFGWASQELPGVKNPDPHDLPEHLTDFWSGREVSLGAEDLSCLVVPVLGMVQSDRHVLRYRHRADRQPLLQQIGERCCLGSLRHRSRFSQGCPDTVLAVLLKNALSMSGILESLDLPPTLLQYGLVALGCLLQSCFSEQSLTESPLVRCQSIHRVATLPSNALAAPAALRPPHPPHGVRIESSW